MVTLDSEQRLIDFETAEVYRYFLFVNIYKIIFIYD